MSVTISRLGEQDLERAADNCTLFWQMSASQENLRQFLRDNRNILIVAEANDQPVGQALGYILQGWDARAPKLFLYSVDVVESHRRRGVGRRLIESFREVGRQSGCEEMFVFTNVANQPAMRFYESLGGTRSNPDDVMFEWKADLERTNAPSASQRSRR